MAQVVEKIEELIQPILEDLGLELVDIEYQREQRGWVLRFFLDKEGGINLDACAAASREISTLLDVEDVVPTAYNLEVSSPGLERPLKKLEDFERFAGELVKIKTWHSLDPDQTGKKRKTFDGHIVGIEGDNVILKTVGKRSAEIKISFDQVSKANLQFEF
jgi:ribosome maturation factor RimP